MFRVSCIQLCSSNDVAYNLKRTKNLFNVALKQKTDFILTPEVSSKITLDKKTFENRNYNGKRYLPERNEKFCKKIQKMAFNWFSYSQNQKETT